MRNIEKNISQFIEQQFPALYREEGSNLIAFVKSYFEWLEDTNNVTYKSRRLLDYRDIDNTLDEYLVYFKDKYAKTLPLDTASDKRFLIKNIHDLYKSKGSERSYDILFKSLYNQTATVYQPGDDVLRVSDGEWIQKQYLEVTNTRLNATSLVGNQIKGINSGATATVDSYTQRLSKGKVVDVLEISQTRGTFDTGEPVFVVGQESQIIGEILPRITGSLSAVNVLDGGASFTVGDILDVEGKGAGGKAKVTSTTTLLGRVSFNLVNGGTGYSINAVAQVLPRVDLTLQSIIQPIVADQLVYSVNGGGIMTANALIISVNSNIITTKQFTPGFEVSGNVYTAIKVSTSPISGTFANGETIFQRNTSGGVNTAVGRVLTIVTGTSNRAFYVSNVVGSFITSNTVSNTFLITGSTSSAQAYVYAIAGGSNTGSANIQKIVGGGTGATFRVGDIIDKEIVEINTDPLINYSSTKLLVFNESLPATGNVSVSASSNVVTGVGTFFVAEAPAGTYIQVGNNASKEVRVVSTVTNNISLTVTDPFINNQTTVKLYTDQADYGFPKVSAIGGEDNLGTILNNALSFRELEIGTIQHLAGINPGQGYSLNPYVSVIEPNIAALQIASPFGIKGADAIVTATAGVSTGVAVGVAVIGSGLGYETGERVTLSKLNSSFSVTGSAIVTEQGKQPGYWKNTKGFLSSDKYIHDSKYYQEYSYEVQVPIDFTKYKDVVKSFIHVAGTELFGKFALVSDGDAAATYMSSALSNTDIVIPAGAPSARPVLSRSFLVANSLSAPIVFSRSSNAAFIDSAGQFIEVLSDTPRIDSTQGVLIEGQRTNRAFNPRAEYTSTPTFPTVTPPVNWGSPPSAVPGQYMGYANINGVPCILARWMGIPSSLGVQTFTIGGAATGINETGVGAGNTVINQVYVSLYAGSLTNLSTFTLRCDTEAGGTIFTPNSTLTKIINVRAILGTTSSTVLRWNYLNTSDPVNFTLAVGLPQREHESFASSLILPPAGTRALATRTRELVTIPLSGLNIGTAGACTVLLSGRHNAADTNYLVSISDSTNNNRISLRTNSTGLAFAAEAVLAGSAVTGVTQTGNPIAPGTPWRVAVIFPGDGSIRVVSDIGTTLVFTGGPTTGLTTLRMGGVESGLTPLFGAISTTRIWPAALTDAEARVALGSL